MRRRWQGVLIVNVLLVAIPVVIGVLVARAGWDFTRVRLLLVGLFVIELFGLLVPQNTLMTMRPRPSITGLDEAVRRTQEFVPPGGRRPASITAFAIGLLLALVVVVVSFAVFR
jgi:hypothetical protein